MVTGHAPPAPVSSKEAMAQLDGSRQAEVTLLSGLSVEDLNDLGRLSS